MKRWKSLAILNSLALILFCAISTTTYAEGPLSKEEKLKIKEEAIQKLNNTEWEIEIRSMDNPKQKSQKDTVVFRKGKIDSKAFSKDGYTGSNLTVNVEDDGHVMWETMQNASGKPPIFWRGEMQSTGINGVISKQLDNGSSESYSFSAVQTATLEPEPEKVAEAPVVLASKSEEVAPAAEEVAAEVAPATEAVVEEVKAVAEEKVEETAKAEVITSKKKSKKK